MKTRFRVSMCGAKPGYVGSLPPRRRLVFGVRSAETALAHLDGTQAPLRNSGGRTSVAVLLAPFAPLRPLARALRSAMAWENALVLVLIRGFSIALRCVVGTGA